mmetsp:Transcript_5960/g.13555  ORF Transcript_5960/g.13555 Transcript_5960/m.13555 type:complete len:313 (-) Transcript_5960:166-1104(-)
MENIDSVKDIHVSFCTRKQLTLDHKDLFHELLPEDLLVIILQRIPCEGLKNTLATSKGWRRASLDPSLWVSLSDSSFRSMGDGNDNLNVDILTRVARRWGNLKHLGSCHIQLDPNLSLLFPQVVSLAAQSVPQAVSLRYGHDFKHLRTLVIGTAGVQPSFYSVVSNCESLQAFAVRTSRIDPHYRAFVEFLAQRAQHASPLRVNLVDETVPVPVNAACGVCGTVLFHNVKAYVKGLPSQPHIQCELFTHSLFETGSLISPTEVQLQCANNCQPGLWVVDAGTRYVLRYNWTFAVACGPSCGMYPDLVFLTPV